MEVKFQNPNYSSYITLNYKQDGYDSMLHFNTYCSSSNCKLAVIENAASFMNLKHENRVEAVNKCKQAVSGRNILITLLTKEDIDWFATNFEHYYVTIVPCGYNGGNQYHILIKNRGGETRKPFKYVRADEINNNPMDKKQVLDIINNAFTATINRDKRLKLISDGLDSIK